MKNILILNSFIILCCPSQFVMILFHFIEMIFAQWTFLGSLPDKLYCLLSSCAPSHHFYHKTHILLASIILLEKESDLRWDTFAYYGVALLCVCASTPSSQWLSRCQFDMDRSSLTGFVEKGCFCISDLCQSLRLEKCDIVMLWMGCKGSVSALTF